MKKILKFSEEQIEQLRSFMKESETTSKEGLRAMALLLLHEGHDDQSMIFLTGIKKTYAFKLRAKFLSKGIEALRQRKKKPKALLTKNQRDEIIKILTHQKPMDFGFESDFWTTSILAQLIKEQYGVQYKTKKHLYLIFKQAKFTFHKPGAKYEKRDEQKIKAWEQQIKPEVEAAMEDPNCVVLVEDEMILTSQTTFQKIWLPEGTFPRIDVAVTRKRACFYGFLDVKTGIEHAFKTERTTGENTVAVLKQVCSRYPGKEIKLFWDNASWHHSKEIKEFLATTKYKIRLINFPPYAPDYNPQEHVWKSGRSNVTHNIYIKKLADAVKELLEYLNTTIFNYKFMGLGA